MCGRFSLAVSKEGIQRRTGVKVEDAILKVSYNIAPSQMAYVIANDNPKVLQRMNWGLIPHWAQRASVGYNLFNARAKKIAARPSFRMPIRRTRCLVPADSFYEWKGVGKQKQPYRIFLKNSPVLLMAGLWDVWYNQYGQEIRTFTIITVPNNKDIDLLHNRMPVILDTVEKQQAWLHSTNLQTSLSLLNTLEDHQLSYYPISQKANSPSYNAADLHDEIMLPPTLF